MDPANRFYYLDIDPFEELTCFVCEFDVNEERHANVTSDFHFQILKSRVLIFTFPNLLVAPDPTNNTNIIIIFKRSNVNGTLLTDFINKEKLKISYSAAVNSTLYEVCFKYTLKAKIAPLWNAMDSNLFVYGRDFLYNSHPHDAVAINTYCTEGSLRLEIKCYKLRMKQISFEELNISPKASHYFCNVPDAVLTEYSIMDLWVYVLPSLKKGKIVSINRKLPSSTSFKNYRTLRRHWKNIYGYRIPDEKDIELYFDINFLPLGSHAYCYPSSCLLLNKPIPTLATPTDTKRISEIFIKDLHTQLPIVLGQATNFSTNDPLVDVPWTNMDLKKYSISEEDYKHNENNVLTNSEKNDIFNVADEGVESLKDFKSEVEIVKFKPTFLPKSGQIKTYSRITKPQLEIISTNFKNNLARIINEETDYTSYPPKEVIHNNTNTKNQQYESTQNNSKYELSPNGYIKIPEKLPIPEKQCKISDYFVCIKPSLSTLQKKDDTPKLPKRKNDFDNGPRKKIKDSNNTFDIRLLALTYPEQLQKISKQELIQWLVSKNIKVTVKMTKQVLIEKIIQAIKNN